GRRFRSGAPAAATNNRWGNPASPPVQCRNRSGRSGRARPDRTAFLFVRGRWRRTRVSSPAFIIGWTKPWFGARTRVPRTGAIKQRTRRHLFLVVRRKFLDAVFITQVALSFPIHALCPPPQKRLGQGLLSQFGTRRRMK